MNKTHRTLSVIVLSSTLMLPATENLQQDTPQTISFYMQTTTQLQQAWQNKWVKVGTLSTACALVYAVGVRLNIIPAPSLPTLSLFSLPLIAKNTVDNLEITENKEPDSNINNTDCSQTETKEQSTENVTINKKTNKFPNLQDLKDATDILKKWLRKGLKNDSLNNPENN